ncbi:hypothetical protein Avbf_00054 [Armadillidium vulgare]|nr:hypothetical protein Avbf_00054 [Armadillidium vulgare]
MNPQKETKFKNEKEKKKNIKRKEIMNSSTLHSFGGVHRFCKSLPQKAYALGFNLSSLANNLPLLILALYVHIQENECREDQDEKYFVKKGQP